MPRCTRLQRWSAPAQTTGEKEGAKQRGEYAERPDLEHSLLPDLVGVTLQSLLARVDELERRVNGYVEHEDIHLPEAGVWRGEDFAI